MPEEMSDVDGFDNIISVDLSPVCINMMKERNLQLRPELKFRIMDSRMLDFVDENFDIVIEKGLSDALLCGTSAFKNVATMLMEAQRVLKTGGLFISVSYGEPDKRLIHLKRAHLNWEVKSMKLSREQYGHEVVHYIYFCRKLDGA